MFTILRSIGGIENFFVVTNMYSNQESIIMAVRLHFVSGFGKGHMC